MPKKERNGSDPKKKEGGTFFSASTLSVWTAILLLCVVLAFGYRQIGGWVQGLQEELGQVARDNKLLLEGLDELLARSGRPDRVAGTESSSPSQPSQETAALEKGPSNNLPTKYKIYYRTKEGEDLKGICERFGVSEDQIRLWNALKPDESLVPGQVVVVHKEKPADMPTDVARASPPPDLGAKVAKSEQPAAQEPAPPEVLRDRQPPEDLPSHEAIAGGGGDTSAQGTGAAPAPEGKALNTASDKEALNEPVEEIVHTVRAGETLSDIGQEYGVPWSNLAEYNHIADPETIYEGQRIQIHIDEAPSTPASTNERTHIVRTGENLYRIGLKYGVNWEQIARVNNILDTGILFEGQVLKIPAAMGGPEP